MDSQRSATIGVTPTSLDAKQTIDILGKYAQSIEGRIAAGTKLSNDEDADRKRIADLSTKLLQLCTDPTEILDQYASNVSHYCGLLALYICVDDTSGTKLSMPAVAHEPQHPRTSPCKRQHILQEALEHCRGPREPAQERCKNGDHV